MPNVKLLAGFIIAFTVGALCRVFGVPVPAPPALLGALMVVAMTCGYLAGNKLFHNAAGQDDNCGDSAG
jgi:XapX domain-containing protein